MKLNREIESVKISQGDEVKVDDVLFTLVESENDELKQAQAELKQLKNDYESAMLDAYSSGYESDNAEVKALQETLDLAESERESLGTAPMTLTEAKEKMDSAQAIVDTYTDQVNEIQTEITQVEGNSSAYGNIRAEVQELESAENALSQAKTAYESQVTQNGGQSVAELNNEIQLLENEIENMEDGNGKEASQKKLSSLRSIYDKLLSEYEKVTSAQEKVNSATIALNDKKATETSRLMAKLDTAQIDLSTAKTNYANMQSTYNMVENIKNAEVAVKQAKDALDAKTTSLAAQKKQDGISQEKLSLSLENQKITITQKEEEIRKLEEEYERREIKAKYNGVISSVNISAGDITTAGEPIAVIETSDLGYTADISVSTEYSEYIKIGGTADTEWTLSHPDGLSATIINIKDDQENIGEKKIVTLQIDESVTIGETFTFLIPISSNTYDAIIPKSAVHTDEKGKFVFVVTSKSTALGNRYVATRKSVTVEASDDVQAAVSGINSGDYVITNSSKPVDTGNYVRISDSSEV